jgi:hypothetical protein
MSVGTIMLFHGQALHAGLGYDKKNVRIHFYCTNAALKDERVKYSNWTY